jgi:hypothetical protein
LTPATSGAVRTWRANVNADAWKRFVHARLLTPADAPGALLLWSPEHAMTHQTTAKSLTAEVYVERMDRRRGLVREWKINSRNNHRLDAMGLAACAADMCGVVVVRPPAPVRPAASAGYTAARPAAWKIGR